MLPIIILLHGLDYCHTSLPQIRTDRDTKKLLQRRPMNIPLTPGKWSSYLTTAGKTRPHPCLKKLNETVSVANPIVAPTNVLNRIQEILTILIVLEDRLFLIAAYKL